MLFLYDLSFLNTLYICRLLKICNFQFIMFYLQKVLFIPYALIMKKRKGGDMVHTPVHA